MCICMVWIYHTFSDSYVYEILGMQSENPTLEETGKASSRHSWFKCLQARQKNKYWGRMIPYQYLSLAVHVVTLLSSILLI